MSIIKRKIAALFLLSQRIVPWKFYKKYLFTWHCKFDAPPHISRQHMRNDLESIEIGPDIHLFTFWVERKNGSGPCINLCLKELEVLRFDCFGFPEGHFHIRKGINNKSDWGRIFLHEKSRLDQINRSLYEIETNLEFYLALNSRPNIRNIKINSNKLAKGLNESREKLISFLSHFE